MENPKKAEQFVEHTPEMTVKMGSFFRLVLKTFTREKIQQSLKSPGFEKNIQALLQAVENITASDVCLEQSLPKPKGANVNGTDVKDSKVKLPRIIYIRLFENQDVSVGIFALKENASLPLHNHPNMRGILKVLTGRVEIQSFTPLEAFDPDASLVVCKRHQLQSVDSDDSACLLDSRNRNLHEIKHVDGDFAAFLDILSPPYTDFPDEHGDERDCFYYQVAREDSIEDQTFSFLERINTPPSYTCDSVTYKGPKLE